MVDHPEIKLLREFRRTEPGSADRLIAKLSPPGSRCAPALYL
jgi:hypothetical protein